MTIDDTGLRQVRDFWNSGEAVEAGRVLFEGMEIKDRPKWAAAVLRLVHGRSKIHFPQIQELLLLGNDPAEWPKAKQLFSSLRGEVLRLEDLQARNVDQEDALYQLFVAETVAKVIYNATDPFDPFDDDSGWWIAGCLRDYVDYLQDNVFAQQAWEVLTFSPSQLSDP